MKKNILISVLFGVLFLFFSCNLDYTQSRYVSENEKKDWTVLIYMAGDNNLSASALMDLNELEAACPDASVANIIVLCDASSFYVSSDFAGTRLYKVKKDDEGMNYKIVSEQLNCSELGLNKNISSNLNMADEKVLEGFINYSVKKFPADHYGFLMWGHGNGWRSASTRAVAFDDSVNEFMSISKVRSALENSFKNKIDFVGFDTCFGSEMEVMYELKNCASFFAGVEGLEDSDGWNYEKLFTELDLSKCRDGYAFGTACVNAFNQNNSFTKMNCFSLTECEKVFKAFEECCNEICLNLMEVESDEKQLLLKDIFAQVKKYYVNGILSDVYVDLYDFVKFWKDMEWISEQSFENFKNELNVMNCSKGNDENFGVGIYFSSVDSFGNFIPSFSRYYINGNFLNEQSMFVKESVYYVPSVYENRSVLDLLF